MDLQYIINEINENLGIDILDKKEKGNMCMVVFYICD